MNYWSNAPKFMASLLKAYYGDHATRENDFGYHYLPKIGPSDNHSWGYLFDKMYAGQMEGLISFGMNPVANGPNSLKMIKALGKLKWLIVAENFETETAAFWNAQKLADKDYPAADDPARDPNGSFPAAGGLLCRERRRVCQFLPLGAMEARGAGSAWAGQAGPGDHCRVCS